MVLQEEISCPEPICVMKTIDYMLSWEHSQQE